MIPTEARPTIIRAPHERAYVPISRRTAQDSRLSFEARGVLLYLLSKPDDWEVKLTDLRREGSIGRDKLHRLLNDLEKLGYLQVVQERNPKTQKFQRNIYQVHEEPCADDLASPDTEKPSTAEPSTANPRLHNTDKTQKTDSTPGGASAPPGGQPPKRKPRPRDPILDMLAYCIHNVPLGQPLGRDTGGQVARVKRELKERFPDHPPDTAEIRTAFKWWEFMKPTLAKPKGATAVADLIAEHRQARAAFLAEQAVARDLTRDELNAPPPAVPIVPPEIKVDHRGYPVSH